MKRVASSCVVMVVALFIALPSDALSLLPGKTLGLHWTGSTWVKVSTPSPSGGDEMNGVDATAGSDVWAVGQHGKTQIAHPLLEHWSGSTWAVVNGPTTPSGSWLDGVDTISATDAWAVGHDALGQKGQPLIEQWDGTRWTLPAEPIVSGGELLAIDHVSKDDAWAVGFRNAKTLIEHWDGSHWSVVASPNGSGTSSELRGVVAVSTGDVWAVGATFPNQKPGKPLTEHWNGSTWSVVPTPVAAGVLQSAAARGSRDVFAAGISFNARGCLRTLVLHWAGSSWTQMTTPNPFSCDNELLGIDASAAGVEAVGDHPQNCPGKTCRGVTLTTRLQNGGWHLQSSPSTTMKFNRLNAVSMVPGTSQAWAVGIATNSFIA